MLVRDVHLDHALTRICVWLAAVDRVWSCQPAFLGLDGSHRPSHRTCRSGRRRQGYEKGDPAGRGSPNSRNGNASKTLTTKVGDVPLDVPRDRAGTFERRLVPKGSRRAGGLDEPKSDRRRPRRSWPELRSCR
jgi:hypothetical protein